VNSVCCDAGYILLLDACLACNVAAASNLSKVSSVIFKPINKLELELEQIRYELLSAFKANS
jgi:hypothetical protein